MRRSRSRRLFWAAVAGVVAGALVVGWSVFALVARPLPAELVQVSVSPDGRWQVSTWFVGGQRLGHHEGVLRVDVSGPAGHRSASRTVYAERVANRESARRSLLWRDASHLVLPLAGGGEVVLDAARAPAQSTPEDFAVLLRATGAAVACVLGVLVGGILSVLLLDSWLIRREKARWEAWPVDWTGDPRSAPRG
jgi:hypothetical protein